MDNGPRRICYNVEIGRRAILALATFGFQLPVLMGPATVTKLVEEPPWLRFV